MKPFTVAISSFFAFAFVVTVKAQIPAFTRTDFHVASTDGVQVFVREVTSGKPRKGTVAVILVHGARVPGLASFDLEVANGSLAEEIARNGHPVYIMDARGWTVNATSCFGPACGAKLAGSPWIRSGPRY